MFFTSYLQRNYFITNLRRYSSNFQQPTYSFLLLTNIKQIHHLPFNSINIFTPYPTYNYSVTYSLTYSFTYHTLLHINTHTPPPSNINYYTPPPSINITYTYHSNLHIPFKQFSFTLHSHINLLHSHINLLHTLQSINLLHTLQKSSVLYCNPSSLLLTLAHLLL